MIFLIHCATFHALPLPPIPFLTKPNSMFPSHPYALINFVPKTTGINEVNGYTRIQPSLMVMATWILESLLKVTMKFDEKW